MKTKQKIIDNTNGSYLYDLNMFGKKPNEEHIRHFNAVQIHDSEDILFYYLYVDAKNKGRLIGDMNVYLYKYDKSKSYLFFESIENGYDENYNKCRISKYYDEKGNVLEWFKDNDKQGSIMDEVNKLKRYCIGLIK